jgi:dipeptidyl aminopeptidase/acylaminoacyl peptidase
VAYRFAALVCCLIALVASPASAGDLASFGKLPTIEGVDISPDGKRLAMIRTDGERRLIVIVDLNASKPIGSIGGNDTKVRDIQWADNDHLLVTMSQTTSVRNLIAARQDWLTGVIYDVNTQKQKPLLGPTDVESLNALLSRPVVRVIDGRTYAVVQGMGFADNVGIRSVFRTEVATGRSQMVMAGAEATRDYLINAKGQVAAELQYKADKDSYIVRLREGDTMRPALLPPNATGFSLEGFSADGASVLVSYRLGDDDNVLAAASTQTPDWKKLNPGDSSAMFDHATGRLTGFADLKEDLATYDYSDQADREVWTAITKAYQGTIVTPVSQSADRRRIVVFADSPEVGPAYMLVDLGTGQASLIGAAYNGVKPADLSEVKPVKYTAADGTKISGYLTLPHGKAAKALPLIVLPHGGPASRDQPGFDWWAQALASRGYAVLQPNFRGSTGYGRTFLEAGFGEWGRKMQTDLSDGVRYLAKEGVIDSRRVCIVGASYGGYAALAGAALDTGVYRCAASIAGPADLRRMLVTERSDSGQEAFRYWKRFMGVEGLRDPDLASISPASHADAVTIPLLLVHGKDDTVVLYEQSRIMADAMKRAGKPVEFVTLDGEDHWLSRGATRLKMLEAVTAFVEKNNPPG